MSDAAAPPSLIDADRFIQRHFCVLCAVVLLVTAAVYSPVLLMGVTLTTDDCIYAWVGRNIVSGRGISDWQGPHTMFPPGYPFLVGTAYLLTGSLETACRLAVFLAAVAVVLLLMILANRLFGPVTGLAVGAMAALNPSFIGLTYNGGSEMPFVLLSVIAMYAAVRAISGKSFGGLLSGLAIGAAYLIRPEALLFVPVLIVLLIAVRKARSVGALLLFILSLMVCIIPYSFFLHKYLGIWTLSGKGKTLVVDNPFVTSNPEKALYTLKDRSQSYSGDFIGLNEDAGRSAISVKNYARNFRTVIGASRRIMGIPALLLVTAGIVLTFKRRKLPAAFLASLLPLPIVLAMPLFFIRDRYLAAAVPMVLLWAALGVNLLINNRRGWMRAAAVLLVAASVVTGVQSLVRTVRDQENPIEQQIAGRWLNRHSKPGQGVMSRKPWTPFYADRPWVITPLASYRDTVAFARLRGAHYLVVDERYTAPLRPDLRFLLDPSGAPEELEPVYTIDRSPDGKKLPRVVIYRLRQESVTPRPVPSRPRMHPGHG